MGDSERGIIQQARRTRQQIPEKILKAPVLEPGLDFYWSAFLLLSSERHTEGAIPWRAMQAYCDEIGRTDPDDRDDFYMLLRELDMEFLRLQAEKSKKSKGKPGPPGRRKGR